jgi:hypothetical protein
MASFSRATLGTLVLATAAGVATAQIAAPAPASGYGTEDLQVVDVPFASFLPIRPLESYWTECCQPGLTGERWINSGAGTLIAAIDASLVPNGADLADVSFYVYDGQGALPGVNLECRLCRSWVDVDGSNPSSDCPFVVATSGGPGDTVIGGDPNLQVRYQFDVDADGQPEVVSHYLSVHFAQGDVTGQLRFRSARLLFRRQVSPAAAPATFSDVPTSHPFFQFVEALAASGITAGCGTGIYCPDSPLTRGQMAVFLAKALGLHWPGPGIP